MTTPETTWRLVEGFASAHTPDLLDDKLWLGHRASGGRWTARFVTRTDAGFGFLSVFLEVLMRRARSVLSVSYYASKVRFSVVVGVKANLVEGQDETATRCLEGGHWQEAGSVVMAVARDTREGTGERNGW